MNGAILAGGAARRLAGWPKGLLEIEGVALVDRLVRLLREVGQEPEIIGDPAGPYAGRGVPIRPDVLPDRGPAGGVLTALAAAAPGWVCVVSVDLPLLDALTLQALADRRAGQHVVLAHAGGHRQPLAAWWHTRALPVLEAHLRPGPSGFAPILADLEVTEVALPAEPFRDVDTEADRIALGLHWPSGGQGGMMPPCAGSSP